MWLAGRAALGSCSLPRPCSRLVEQNTPLMKRCFATILKSRTVHRPLPGRHFATSKGCIISQAETRWSTSGAFNHYSLPSSYQPPLSSLGDERYYTTGSSGQIPSSTPETPIAVDNVSPSVTQMLHTQQIRREARMRTALALYVALSREVHLSNRTKVRNEQSQSFSSTSGGGSSSKFSDDRKAKSASVKSETSEEDSSSPDWIEDLSSQQQTRTTIPDDYSETYRYIRLKQEANRENARARTAANVQRALAGNVVICAAKLGAWISSGSSSMLSEFVHSVVDCGNQALLLLGLRDSGNVADKSHPYGYGKSVYFWSLRYSAVRRAISGDSVHSRIFLHQYILKKPCIFPSRTACSCAAFQRSSWVSPRSNSGKE